MEDEIVTTDVENNDVDLFFFFFSQDFIPFDYFDNVEKSTFSKLKTSIKFS